MRRVTLFVLFLCSASFLPMFFVTSQPVVARLAHHKALVYVGSGPSRTTDMQNYTPPQPPPQPPSLPPPTLSPPISSLSPPPITVETPQPPPPSPPSSTDVMTGPWAKVAVCEEGGRNDPTFGYFGIYPSSWSAYGGGEFSPTAGGTSWDNQVTVAERIQANPPDQYGCAGGW